MSPRLNFLQLSGQVDSHCVAVPGQQALLHPMASDAFIKMQKDAARDGITLGIASGFRSLERQLRIWNRKWRGEASLKDLSGQPLNIEEATTEQKLAAILHWSALPGSSRHHWGSDFDVYDPQPFASGDRQLQLEPEEYCQSDGPCYAVWQWLCEYAQHYGFFFPYARYQGGVAKEPWHLSYRPLAANLTAQLTVANLQSLLEGIEIEGKSAVIEHLADIKTRYIDNINEEFGWTNTGSG